VSAMWESVKDNLQFSSVQTVVIDEWRLGLSVKILQVSILAYIMFDFFYLCSHLEIDTSVGGTVFLAVTDLTDMQFNATPARQTCQEMLGSLTPWNGASEYGTYDSVRLRAISGQGFSRHGETSLTVNTLIEPAERTQSSCGSPMDGPNGTAGCPSITQSTPYSEVFGGSSEAAADALCILDWQRYVLMLNATFHSPGDPHMRPINAFWLQNATDSRIRIPLLQSKTDQNPRDWIEEALPAVRKGDVFRSDYWSLIYVSMSSLLAATGTVFDPVKGKTVLITLEFTNRVPWFIFGRQEVDVIIKITEEAFWPFRETSSLGGTLHSSWHRSGVKVVVKVTASVARFTFAKFGIVLVSYSSYLLVAVALVKFMLLYGHLPGVRLLNRCVCFALQCGNLHRTGASTSWYRSLLLKRSPEVASTRFTSVRLVVRAGQNLGMTIDQHTFFITDIKEDSVIGEWNEDNECRSIEAGDILVQVNGFSKDTPFHAMEELDSMGVIEMTIRHGQFNQKESMDDMGFTWSNRQTSPENDLSGAEAPPLSRAVHDVSGPLNPRPSTAEDVNAPLPGQVSVRVNSASTLRSASNLQSPRSEVSC